VKTLNFVLLQSAHQDFKGFGKSWSKKVCTS